MISLIFESLSLKLRLNSKHLWVFLENLRQISEILGHLRRFSKILGKCSGTFVWPSEQFWKILGNLRKVVGNLRKIIKKSRHQYVYTIKRTLHVSSKIWIWCSRGKNNISLVRCTSEILFLPLKHKIHIFSPSCNILYIFARKNFVLSIKL